MADAPPTHPPSKRTVFVRRASSTVCLWALVTATFFSGKAWAFVALIGVLTMIAAVEYFKMLRAADVKCFPRFGILLSAAYCAALYWGFLGENTVSLTDLDAFMFFIAATGAFTLQLRHPIRGTEALLAPAATVLGVVYTSFLFNFAARLVFIVPGDGEVPGAFVLLWLLAVTKFTDMGAYITGSLIGRNKMIPHVSPGKTWEGFFGALFFAQLAGCGLYLLFPEQLAVFGNWGHVVLLGFLLALLAVIGDLAESIVKRSVNAKDSGRMLPGIGGSLDLIDSVCFTAPALYFYLKWVLLPAS